MDWELFMAITLEIISKGNSRLIYLLGCVCVLTGIITGALYSRVYAATDDSTISSQNPVQLSACTPPDDWNQTVRLKNPQKPTKQWTFNVSDPEMEVSLVFFYYQDYDRSGCPFDCSTGDCQTDETGKGVTPLGNINVLDGKEGGNRGVKKIEGHLTQGTYQVVFTANGDPGSINVGLNVKTNALPTATPPQPTDTPIPTTITPTEPPPPTETEPPPTDIPTTTVTTPPPLESPTPSATQDGPTPTGTDVKRTPPATLPPPTPLPGSSTPMVLIPVTGARTAGQSQGSGINGWLVIPLGIGVFGLGIAFYGIATRLKQE
jgi:hypothetical protein